MDKIEVKYTASNGAVIPEYKTAGAAGADVYAYLPQGSVTIKSGKFAMIPTGVFYEIPMGYEIQVRPRSGLAFKNGITVLNSPGTIDSDYRGELKILLINFGEQDFTINNGDRIAQIIISSVVQAEFSAAESLSKTERGEGGFGSTGV
ncbi:MAG: dUTP diphosphatase [Treponema sp.]|nr:dUTP diphosphatase [Treponema sp.]